MMSKCLSCSQSHNLISLLLIHLIVTGFCNFHLLLTSGFVVGPYYDVRLLSSHPSRIDQKLSAKPETIPLVDDHKFIRKFQLLDENENDKDGSTCFEIAPPPKRRDEEEDEVEQWYPTTRRTFLLGPNDIYENNIMNKTISSIHKNNDDVDYDCFQIQTKITIRQTSFGCGKLGSSIWPSAIALCCHLQKHPLTMNSGVTDQTELRILELGAGCGLPSALLSQQSSLQNGSYSILATDFWQSENNFDKDRLFPNHLFGTNLAHNIQQKDNQNEAYHPHYCEVLRFDWHENEQLDNPNHPIRKYQPDIIIGSDLIYYPSDVDPFLQTLTKLLVHYGAKKAIFFFPSSDNDGNGQKEKREALPEFKRKLLLLHEKHKDEGMNIQLDEVELHEHNDIQSSQDRFLRLVIDIKF